MADYYDLTDVFNCGPIFVDPAEKPRLPKDPPIAAIVDYAKEQKLKNFYASDSDSGAEAVKRSKRKKYKQQQKKHRDKKTERKMTKERGYKNIHTRTASVDPITFTEENYSIDLQPQASDDNTKQDIVDHIAAEPEKKNMYEKDTTVWDNTADLSAYYIMDESATSKTDADSAQETPRIPRITLKYIVDQVSRVVRDARVNKGPEYQYYKKHIRSKTYKITRNYAEQYMRSCESHERPCVSGLNCIGMNKPRVIENVDPRTKVSRPFNGYLRYPSGVKQFIFVEFPMPDWANFIKSEHSVPPPLHPDPEKAGLCFMCLLAGSGYAVKNFLGDGCDLQKNTIASHIWFVIGPGEFCIKDMVPIPRNQHVGIFDPLLNFQTNKFVYSIDPVNGKPRFTFGYEKPTTKDAALRLIEEGF